MKINPFCIIKTILLASAVIMTFLIFIPRNYKVHKFHKFQKRENTKYWELATGSKIGYTRIKAKGDKKPFPIIYLHGGPGGPIFDSNIKSLAPLSEDGFDIYLYDQIGGGHSGRLDNINEYTTKRHKEDLEKIVKKIGAEKVILIGQSWGAMLATLFVTDNPEKVDKIIFTGPGPILPVRPELAKLKSPDSLQFKEPLFTNQKGNKKANNLRSKCMLYWAYIFGKKLVGDYEADEFYTFLNNELNKSTFCDTSRIKEAKGGGGYYAHIMTVKSFQAVKDLRSKIKELKTAVLVIKGQCDNQKWGYTQEYLSLFQNNKLVILPNAGHAIAAEAPVLYLQTIRDFLNK